MTYQEAYEYFDSLRNIPRNSRSEYHSNNSPSTLKTAKLMLNLAGNPELKIPHYVHVTGTSGKGSVSTMMSNILSEAGYKVGLLTSPHVSKITERWSINGVPMSDRDFAEIIEELRPVFNRYFNERREIFPTTFTINTVIALTYFAKKKVDYAVVEVSVGGERDSTNAIPHKELAIITNIGIDHTGVLGNTKAEIAQNKAGIIKPKSIVVTSERDEKLIKIIKGFAQKRRASDFVVLDSDRYASSNKDIIKCDWNGTDFVFDGDKYHINNLGHHQITNAELAIVAAKKIGISLDAIKKGISATEFPIRLEVISQKPYIIIDGAHNTDKIKSTVLGIASIKNKYKNLHLLIGFSDNKDYKKFIKELISLKPVSISCTRFTKNLFRKPADPKKLAKIVKGINPKIEAESFLEPEFALDWSRKKLKKDDLLVITGSMFLSGELRPHFKKIK